MDHVPQLAPDARRALEAMTAALDARLRHGGADRAREILDGLAMLFVRHVEALGPAGVLAFDEAFLRLAPVNAVPARARLAHVVAPFPNSPRRTVRLLAFDEEAEVAVPVLRASPLLDEADLLLLARERGIEHLLALAQRGRVPEPLTDLLVQRGGPAVALAAARNRGAAFSNRVSAQLLDQAKAAADLRRALQLRTDLPKAQLERIGLAVRAAGSPAAAPRSVAKLGTGFRAFLARTAAERPPVGQLSQALLAVHGVVQAQGLSEARVADWFRTGEHDKAVAGVAYVTRLPVSLVQRAHRSAEPDGFELILRAAGYGYDTFELALMSNPAWTLDAATVERLVADYRELRPEEAQLAIRLAMAGGPAAGASRRAS